MGIFTYTFNSLNIKINPFIHGACGLLSQKKRLSSSKWILSKMKAALSLLPLKLNELVVAFVFLSWAGDVPHLLQPQPPIPILVARPVRRGDTPDKHNICPNPSYLSISLVP